MAKFRFSDTLTDDIRGMVSNVKLPNGVSAIFFIPTRKGDEDACSLATYVADTDEPENKFAEFSAMCCIATFLHICNPEMRTKILGEFEQNCMSLESKESTVVMVDSKTSVEN